ncbi:hypothetical protein Pcinc_042223 [Petrolisthes cinctipes]|uniref:Uncharacterized protein n=1 Tax=Petrolisthes cinctipes TaxID=88211 RepID=A0AAE1BKE2_PETCI|nr:hypothetical protein Pcinc_042223 [Petrolisthes cinctipes]
MVATEQCGESPSPKRCVDLSAGYGSPCISIIHYHCHRHRHHHHSIYSSQHSLPHYSYHHNHSTTLPSSYHHNHSSQHSLIPLTTITPHNTLFLIPLKCSSPSQPFLTTLLFSFLSPQQPLLTTLPSSHLLISHHHWLYTS